MTGKRDIERTLDAWFVDGPSVMPDRLFDAVLDQVERTPQRPFARLRLRLTEMTPRIRMLAAAAAALIVAVVSFALIGRAPDVGPTPSPSAAQTLLASPSPSLFAGHSEEFDPFVGSGETPSPRSGAPCAGWRTSPTSTSP